MSAGPFLIAAGEPGALQALRPLPGCLAETGLERSGEVVADAGRPGLAGELAGDNPGSERGDRGRWRPRMTAKDGAQG